MVVAHIRHLVDDACLQKSVHAVSACLSNKTSNAEEDVEKLKVSGMCQAAESFRVVAWPSQLSLQMYLCGLQSLQDVDAIQTQVQLAVTSLDQLLGYNSMQGQPKDMDIHLKGPAQ